MKRGFLKFVTLNVLLGILVSGGAVGASDVFCGRRAGISGGGSGCFNAIVDAKANSEICKEKTEKFQRKKSK